MAAVCYCRISHMVVHRNLHGVEGALSDHIVLADKDGTARIGSGRGGGFEDPGWAQMVPAKLATSLHKERSQSHLARVVVVWGATTNVDPPTEATHKVLRAAHCGGFP